MSRWIDCANVTAANNLAGPCKRAIGIGFQLTLGNLGGAVGSNIYLQREAPYYWVGYGFSLAIIVAAVVSAVFLRLALSRINQKRDQMSREEVFARYTRAELSEMGGQSPLFRYTL